jgi:hypothetical protein
MATLREGRASSISWEIPLGSPVEERIFLVQVSALGEGRAVTGFAFSTVDITPSHRWREALIETGMALGAHDQRRPRRAGGGAAASPRHGVRRGRHRARRRETATLASGSPLGFADDAAAIDRAFDSALGRGLDSARS